MKNEGQKLPSYPKRAPDKAANAAKDYQRVRNGCLAIPIGFTIFVGFGAYLGVQDDKEWAAARPADVSEVKWKERRDACESIEMSPADCAVTPENEVQAAAEQQEKEQRAELCAEDAAADAKTEAREAVDAGLISPSTSDFDWASARAVHDGCNWTVTGQLDAQNSFGAMLRSSYRVKLMRATEDTWIVTSVEID